MSEARPGALDLWRYILRYLGAAFGLALVVTIGVSIAAFGARRDADAVGARLADGDLRSAFELVETPRLFSGRATSDTLLPPNDPLQSRFGPTEEEGLAAAFSGVETLPPTGRAARPAEQCQDPVCLVASLTRPGAERDGALNPRLRAFAYFLARRAMVRGEALPELGEQILRRYPSFWVRAFRAEVMTAGSQPTNAAPAMLSMLHEELDSAARGALVFSGYGALVTLIFGVATLFWWRRRRPEETT